LLSLAKTKTVSHSWAFNRLLCRFIEFERCLSTAGGYRTIHSASLLVVVCCFGSRVRHVVSSALRGPFSIVGMLPALRGLFFLVDMLQALSGLFSVVDVLPGSPLSGHLPFCCLLLVAAIVLVSCCVSSITVGSVGTFLALMAFGHGPLTGISSLVLVLFVVHFNCLLVRSVAYCGSLPVQSLTSDHPCPIQKSTPVVLPVIPDFWFTSLVNFVRCFVDSFSLVDCHGDSLL
jgi:hypothetical protein